jgi:hypothetical protein
VPADAKSKIQIQKIRKLERICNSNYCGGEMCHIVLLFNYRLEQELIGVAVKQLSNVSDTIAVRYSTELVGGQGTETEPQFRWPWPLTSKNGLAPKRI